MEIDVLYLYSPNFIFNHASVSVLDISNLVLILLLLLIFSRQPLNILSLSLCLDEIFLALGDNGCSCFLVFSPTFTSCFVMMFFTDSLNSSIRYLIVVENSVCVT